MNLKQQLIRDEGKIPFAYEDSEGWLTCGIGFLVDERKGARIPEAVMDYWLEYNIFETRSQLKQRCGWWLMLDDVRRDCIVNMAYQLGVDGVMGFKKMIAAIKAGDFHAAADEMLDSKWARQTPGRAERLSMQMRTGQYY